MAFEGDLKNLPLADVLQSIHQNNLTGTLSVKDTKGERRVAFSGGYIVAYRPAPGDGHPVIDALAKRRIVAKAEAEKARSGFLGKRKTLRMALAQRGLVKEEDYQRVVKEDVLEGIYELFLETDRTFRFEDGQPDLAQWDQDQLCAELKLAAAGIVMEGARRTDEWGRIRRAIGSMSEVLVRDSDTPEEGDDEMVKEILALADGSRDLQGILDKLPVPRFKGCEVVAQLVGARRLRPASTNEYTTLARRAEERGAFDEAASYYERGLATERGNLDLRRGRANALERAGRASDAAGERQILAQALLDQGKRTDAAAELQKAADLAPRDPHPLELRLKLAQEAQDKDAVRVVGARLAALYEDLGLGEKARELLRAQASRSPDDEELRERLGELLFRQGDVKSAAKEWRELAGRAARRENLALAAARYRRAVEVDPGDEGARAALRDIETGELLARRVRRRQRVRLAGFVLVLASFGGWAFWEADGVRSLHEAEVKTVYDRIGDGTPEGLEDAIRAVVAQVHGPYRFTVVARAQSEAITEKLVELYAKAFERAMREPVVPQARPGRSLAEEDVLPSLAKALDPEGKPTLEALVRTGDESLASDRARASVAFDEVVGRVQQARSVLAQASIASRNRPDVGIQIQRLGPALARARVGRVRALSLDDRSRATLERLLGPTLPAVLPPPEKK